jgi:hypothetical protein
MPAPRNFGQAQLRPSATSANPKSLGSGSMPNDLGREGLGCRERGSSKQKSQGGKTVNQVLTLLHTYGGLGAEGTGREGGGRGDTGRIGEFRI